VFLFSKINEKICKSQYEIKKNNTETKNPKKSENKNNEDVIKIKNNNFNTKRK
jgi:hypothetical protein